MNLIEIKNLQLKFQERTIFKNLNLTIPEGEFTSVLGPNGTGKSTLVKILLGLVPYEGYINIGRYNLEEAYYPKIRRIISAVFDDAQLHFLGETVRDDLAYTLENLEYSKEEMQKAIQKTASLFQIESILDKSSFELNNSERQKVAIASSLIHHPKILILDEALHQLNREDKKLILTILKYLNQTEKLTVILITHNIEDTLLSNRILVLHKGKIYMEGKKEEIFQREETLRKIGIDIPFIVELSNDLILYDLINKPYFDMEELVNDLWK